jgi:cytochrome P450
VSVEAPLPASSNPLRRIATDLSVEWRAKVPAPPGDTWFSARRTNLASKDPLRMLLDAYARHGPIFSLRILHGKVVFMLGPAANHHMLVSHADNFVWRDGSFGDLIPLLGDGMLTIDGPYHRRARRIMLPAFHHDHLLAVTSTMLGEIDGALDGLQAGRRLDIYRWTRELALRVAMRALFGFDPDTAPGDVDMAEEFERGLGFFGEDLIWQIPRGPGTPFRRMQRARRRLDEVIFGEIARRRRSGERGTDLLSLLIDARDEDGSGFSDQELRDQVMTLLFAGHDTTTSTVSFLVYELCRAPHELERLLAEQDELLPAGRAPQPAELMAGFPLLEQAIDETLRLYPPAWIGPRRNRDDFAFGGYTVPAGSMVNYSSWASHRLPEVWGSDVEEFRPARFEPEAKAALPKGAYVPFGGGSRTCIGMRFGQLEVRAIATRLLQRFRPELEAGYELSIRQMPTLSPRGGMPIALHER